MGTFASAIGFGLVTASILALAAVGFSLQFAVTNVLNLAFAEVMGAAGYVALLSTHAVNNIWVAMVPAAVFGALLSYGVNRLIFVPLIRRGTKLFGMVIVTVGVGLIIENIILAVAGPSFTGYTLPQVGTHHIGPFLLTSPQLVIMGLAVVAMILVHLLLRHTKVGVAMRAISVSATLAEHSGIDTRQIVDLTWLISGALGGVAGVALFINVGAFTSATANEFLVVIVAAAVLGGVGDAYGAMLGALVIGLASEIEAAYFNPQFKEVVGFVVLVIVLLARPQGIIAQVAVQREIGR
jgi:branched-chain amino acid transport system permease protein/neutral amino acid transport system permease protein